MTNDLAKAWVLRSMLLFYLGQTVQALESYQGAADAARRTGNVRTEGRALAGAVAAQTHGTTPVAEAVAFTEHAL
jgi:hypothetical protein